MPSSVIVTVTVPPISSEVPVMVGVVSVVVTVGPPVMVSVGAVASAGEVETLFESRVTAALRAMRRPLIDAPVVAVIDVSARIVPLNDEYVPRVAELPTCQNTFAACVPLVRATVLSEMLGLPAAVTSVEPAWKMNTALGSPPPSSVNVPVMSNDVPAE